MMPTKEIERNSLHNDEIDQGIAVQGRAVLVQDHIFDPMQTIFNVPVLASALSKPGSIQGQRINIEHCFVHRSGCP